MATKKAKNPAASKTSGKAAAKTAKTAKTVEGAETVETGQTQELQLASVGIVAIVAATDSPEGCTVAPEAEAKELFEKGLIEVGAEAEPGFFYVRCTDQGRDFAKTLLAIGNNDVVESQHVIKNAVSEVEEVESSNAEAVETNFETVTTEEKKMEAVADTTPEFEIQVEDSMPIPAISGRGGGRKSRYPFDSMNVGQSFFVPLSTDKLASTVSAANARYAVETGETKTNRKGKTVAVKAKTREFVMRSVRENFKGEVISGTRIWRKA